MGKDTQLYCRGLLSKAAFGWAVLIGASGGMTPISAGEPVSERQGLRPFLQAPGIAATAAPKNLSDPLQAVRKAEVRQAYVELPLSFEPNRGQARNRVRFLSRGPGYSYLLLDRELVFQYQSRRIRKRVQTAQGGLGDSRP